VPKHVPSRSAADARPTQPFLKWAGGKQWLAPRLGPVLARCKGRYYEPFVGGGAVYFAVRPKPSTLSDANPELINAFAAIRDSVDAVIRRLRRFDHSAQCYYRVRASRPRSSTARAAKFIYLNRTCWNGLYRVNRQGRFNVPMGRFTHPPDIIAPDRLRAASRALAGVSLLCADFADATIRARKGDMIYFDPPYTVMHTNNGFLRYNEAIFSWEDQQRLAAVVRRLVRAGVSVVVSSARHDSVRQLYRGLRPVTLARSSLIAAAPGRRRSVGELLFCSRDLAGVL